jgi:erythrocyte band 7 integral membrane protein
MGQKTLQQGIEHRESIALEIEEIIGPAAREWGCIVEVWLPRFLIIQAILIKDLKFSQDLQDNLSAAAKQKRTGEAKVISAQGEVDAAKLMREAADILNSPAAMQIRM